MSPPFLQSGCTQGGHSANRLQELCFRNGNIYIKLGQHIAQLVYVQTMRAPMLKRSSAESSRKIMENCHKLVLFELIWRDYFRFHPAKYGNSIFLLE
ncbi:putative ABC1 protein At2g40090 isoform X2 [Aegilops tauschii subsp. strangulata]|uniref:putative ABC1 protein At2g40090 isoform X2 n=1 Tax=Aegilops tauschii subsp. strangulata TaxID=200361 RepID=UPI003CC83F6D